MGIKSRRKGARVEHKIVKYLQERGIAAEKRSRAYLRGADMSVPILGRDRAGEVKGRAEFKWLDRVFDKDEVELLFLVSDYRSPRVVMEIGLLTELLTKAEGLK